MIRKRRNKKTGITDEFSPQSRNHFDYLRELFKIKLMRTTVVVRILICLCIMLSLNGMRNAITIWNEYGSSSSSRSNSFVSQFVPSCSSSKEYKRDHLQSDADSIFNCDPSGTNITSICQYYYPAAFWDSMCGMGREFRYMIDELEAQRKNLSLWKDMPHVGFMTLSLKNACIVNETIRSRRRRRQNPRNTLLKHNLTGPALGQSRPDKWRRCIMERISSIHVHKAGGSSLFHMLNTLGSAFPNNSTLRRYKHHWGTITPIAQNRTEREVISALQHATHYPTDKFAPHQHIMFTTVRDPVDRFISSVGQAVGGNGSQKNKVGKVIINECQLDSQIYPNVTTTDALRCVANYVKENTFWVELHFTPMALDMAFATLWQDVPVAVFHFRHVSTIMAYLGRKNTHMRNSLNNRYRSVIAFRNASADDLDEYTLELVCHMYEVDVLMMRSLGYETPRCYKYLGQKHSSLAV